MSKDNFLFKRGIKKLSSLAKNIDSEKIVKVVETVEKIRSTYSLEKKIKVFIAGSKQHNAERNAIRSEFMKISNASNNKLEIRGYSFEDFESFFSAEGRQMDYNCFIEDEADSVVFVLDNKVGGITFEEFERALKSYEKVKHPRIYVYSKQGILQSISPALQKKLQKSEYLSKILELNSEIVKIKQLINQHAQYYVEYCNILDLQQKVAADFGKYLKS